MGFTIHGEYQDKKQAASKVILGSCNACDRPLTALIRNRNSAGTWSSTSYHGNLLDLPHFEVIGIWPEAPIIAAPENVPEKVARSYVEAAESRRRRAWNAACASYRRTMELALKNFAPDVEAWKLEKRIDKLANEHRITADMQAWAHELRLDGNEALHGDEDATEEMADQMHHLTHFLLVYLYNLPQQIAEVRARRDAGAT
ncbi:DUF4145 domain-containing protein [Variovorax sp. NFACC27]|uniref:DUF4145 domain-containing protein n=1 Tax=unclassified Variovorax TaxID=663243 RepID=UPI000B8A30DB